MSNIKSIDINRPFSAENHLRTSMFLLLNELTKEDKVAVFGENTIRQLKELLKIVQEWVLFEESNYETSKSSLDKIEAAINENGLVNADYSILPTNQEEFGRNSYRKRMAEMLKLFLAISKTLFVNSLLSKEESDNRIELRLQECTNKGISILKVYFVNGTIEDPNTGETVKLESNFSFVAVESAPLVDTGNLIHNSNEISELIKIIAILVARLYLSLPEAFRCVEDGELYITDTAIGRNTDRLKLGDAA